MGFLKKRSRRSTETITQTIIEHKIIKLTYLQTLAIVSGLGDTTEIAGETEGFTAEGIDTAAKTAHLASGKAGSDRSRRAGGIGGDTVGKKKKQDSIKTSIDDKGWRVVKTWLQPEFDKIRYALGIRELTIAQFRYEKVSEVISKPWGSPKDITKVSLIVDQFIPPQFPPGQDYLQFYVKPESPDADWIRINPIDNRTVYDSKGKIVPRIINFNTERPATARLEDAFITTKQEVRQMRFRAVLNRPDSISGSDTPADGYTPILKSYRMLIHPRGGL